MQSAIDLLAPWWQQILVSVFVFEAIYQLLWFLKRYPKLSNLVMVVDEPVVGKAVEILMVGTILATILAFVSRQPSLHWYTNNWLLLGLIAAVCWIMSHGLKEAGHQTVGPDNQPTKTGIVLYKLSDWTETAVFPLGYLAIVGMLANILSI